jgi:TetR/AcrR family transcriptional repressor of multidrug resistance operon
MSQVAERAGVATGTAYVHYKSKEDLLVSAFVEVKTRLGEAALAGIDPTIDPRDLFDRVWRNCYKHVASDPAIADFLLQVEASPLRHAAHEALLESDPLTRTAEQLSSVLVELPVRVLYDLSLAPVVRLVASDTQLNQWEMDTLIESCWRAVHRS